MPWRVSSKATFSWMRIHEWVYSHRRQLCQLLNESGSFWRDGGTYLLLILSVVGILGLRFVGFEIRTQVWHPRIGRFLSRFAAFLCRRVDLNQQSCSGLAVKIYILIDRIKPTNKNKLNEKYPASLFMVTRLPGSQVCLLPCALRSWFSQRNKERRFRNSLSTANTQKIPGMGLFVNGRQCEQHNFKTGNANVLHPGTSRCAP